MTNDNSSDDAGESDSKYESVNRGASTLPPTMTHRKMAGAQGFDTTPSPEARGLEDHEPDPGINPHRDENEDEDE